MKDQTILYPLGDDPPSARLLYGIDCLTALQQLPDRSVHMVATSPPYFRLRDYKVEGQIGLEDSPAAYVARLVEVFREVRRVLRDDGTLWLNLGDSYVTPTQGVGGSQGFSAGGVKRQNNRSQPAMETPIRGGYGDWKVKPKDLLGIPWRVALALQNDGWYLRQELIWAKGNAFPSSVTDRCTTAHEHIFLLAKAERYFFDQEAIREPAVGQTQHDLTGAGYEAPGQAPHTGNRKDLHGPTYSRHRASVPGGQDLREQPTAYRNRRSVWTINTQPYLGAHYATWPVALVEIMIHAGTSEKGCCSQCGAPQSRQLKKRSRGHDGSRYGERALEATGGASSGGTQKSTLGSTHGLGTNETLTLGWQPTCRCGAPLTRCTVLDPFSGSATTGAVALQMGRNYLGIDINEKDFPLAAARLTGRAAPQPASDEDDVLDLF